MRVVEAEGEFHDLVKVSVVLWKGGEEEINCGLLQV
jgi:hypothetical protein